MKKNEWFSIHNIGDFVDSARKLVFHFFDETNKNSEEGFLDAITNMSESDMSELNTTLTHEESYIIVMNYVSKKINKKTGEPRYYITDQILMDIVEALNSRMISNILNNLVNKGVIETAYDSDIDDFIFWIKETESEKPETD